MSKIRRINIFSGPGSGKSVLATWLFAELKIAGVNIQFVDEYVKKWAYEGKQITSFDQIYLFAKQMYKEESYLRAGAEHIISDSPILMIGGYASRNNDPFKDELISLALKFNKLYPSINIFLDRDGIPYQRDGRYEDYEKAKLTDKFILDVLKENVDYKVFKTKDRQQILEYIIEEVKT
jgi:hypothetical protein